MTRTLGSSLAVRGRDGNGVTYGARAPAIADGRIGDWWINTSTGEWYGPKGAGGWGGVQFTIGGSQGWSPIESIVTDGARRVRKIVDWVGGTGAKPAVNKFVGATGLVDLIADGVDVRGPAGLDGTDGALCSVSGTVNAIVLTSGKNYDATGDLVDGQRFRFRAIGPNTGAVTIALDSLPGTYPASPVAVSDAPAGYITSANGVITVATWRAATSRFVLDAESVGVRLDTNAQGLTDAEKANGRTNLGVSASTTPNTPAGNISATTVQAALNELDNEKLAKSGGVVTGGFLVNAPLEIVKFNSAYLTVNSRSLFTEGDDEWLGNAAGGSATQYAYGSFAQGVFLSSIGDVGVVGATRTEDATTSGRLPIGSMGWAFNFNTESPQTAWAGYFESRRKTGAGQVHGVEINVTELGSTDVTVPTAKGSGPSAAYSSTSSVLNLAIGGNTTIPADGGWDGEKIAYAVNAGVFLTLYGNGARAHKGIIISENALVGADGSGGSNLGTAIELARGHMMTWIDGTTRQASKIYSDVSSSGVALQQVFSDYGVLFGATSRLPALQVIAHADDVVGLQISGGNSTDNRATLTAVGSSDSDLALAANGIIRLFSLAQPRNLTVSSLPAASSAYAGCIAVVTDHNAAPVYGATPVGGGSTKTLVFCDGSAWKIR